MVAAAAAAIGAKKRREKRAAKLKAKEEARQKAIEAWFKAYDKSGTGTMSRDEMHEVLTAVKRDELKDQTAVVDEKLLDEVMKYADVSGDGQIEPRHLLAAIKKYKSLMSDNEHLKVLFEKHDKDKSGDLDKEQLLSLLMDVAPGPHKHASEADADYILTKCDVNNSGSITWMELSPAIATWMEISKDVAPETEDSGKSSACVLL